MKTNGSPSETILRIRGFVISDPSSLRKRIGMLEVNRAEFNFGNILDTEVKRDSILIRNSSDKEMELIFEPPEEKAENFKLELGMNPLPSGASCFIYGELHGDPGGEYGFVRYRYTFYDKHNPEKQRGGLQASYTQNEDFSVWTNEERDKAPNIRFSQTTCDFGEKRRKELIECVFEFTNTGKSDLIIRDVRRASFIELVRIDERVKPGEKGELVFDVNLTRSQGEFIRYITVTTNCPGRIKNKLTIRGKIVDR